MKIKLVSDLHLEFSDINIANNEACDVLILSGDIMVAQDLHDHPEPANTADQAAIASGTGLGRRQLTAQRFRDFLKRCSFQFPHVVYVAGNHELYHGKFFASIQYLRDECAKYPNIHFMERDTVDIDGVTFVGATLWTDCNKGDPLTQYHLKDAMNDYRAIRHDYDGYRAIKPKDTMERHLSTKEYIREIVLNVRERKDPQARVVVVTHHSPSYQSVHEQYKSEFLMNGGYHSDLSEFILDHPEIVLWTHGHTHHPFDYKIGECRIMCNPRGYEADGYTEDTGWNPAIEINV